MLTLWSSVILGHRFDVGARVISAARFSKLRKQNVGVLIGNRVAARNFGHADSTLSPASAHLPSAVARSNEGTLKQTANFCYAFADKQRGSIPSQVRSYLSFLMEGAKFVL